jgi:vacuolar-type H+-ATPase subunit C/Vma6
MSVTSVSTYSMVHATVRALYSKRLGPDTWTALVQAKDLDAVFSILSKTAYSSHLILKGITPRRAVYQIRKRLADTYEKLIRLMPGEGSQLLLWLWRLYEVDDIKAVLRGIEARASWEQILLLLYPKPKHALLSLETMQRMVLSGDVARAVEFTRHTPYYNALEHAVERYKAERSLFPLEVALDLEHHRRLWESIEGFGDLDRKWALRIVGSMIDMDNLLWAIRYRIYHHLSEEEIINYTLPFGYQVRDEHIRAIAAGADIVEIVKGIYPKIPIAERLDDESTAGRSLQALELTLQRRIAIQCRAAFIGDPFHIGIPLGYLMLSEYEIKDLTVLIEAKASQLPIETFERIMVFQSTAYADMAAMR